MKIISNKSDFRNRNLIFFDLETTGLNPDLHEIIEIAYILVSADDSRILLEKAYKIKPEHTETADPEAFAVNGYTADKWRDAKNLREVIEEFNEDIKGAMLVGWNICVDYSFLDKAFNRLKIMPKCDYHFIDAMSIAYSKFRSKNQPDGLRLGKIASALGIKIVDRHSALGDVRATYEVFLRLMRENINEKTA